MQRRSILLGGALLCALVAGGAAISAGKTQEAQVNIDNFSFNPAELVVPHGTRVDWMNRDDIPHTVTDAANPRAFKSPPLDSGDGFSHVFETPGTYHYFCSLHPHMTATIVVR